MNQYDKAIAECRDRLRNGAGVEEILAVLREHGVSKTFSIRAMAELEVADLASAKKIVHFSQTWADVRAGDEEFHETLGEIEQYEGPPKSQ
jgi:SOS response regulatory protein OraA/RecX